MSEIKSLANQLRDTMANGSSLKRVPLARRVKKGPVSSSAFAPELPPILTEILEYNSSENKAMVHVKLDEQTARLLGHFKMATGIDNIKLVAFAVRHLFATQPELKTYIKNFIQNLEL